MINDQKLLYDKIIMMFPFTRIFIWLDMDQTYLASGISLCKLLLAMQKLHNYKKQYLDLD